MEKKKVLHVDDDNDTLLTVKKLLEKNDFDVTSVLSGRQALRKIKKEKYDLILVDMMMPDMSGWDLYNKIRKFDNKVKVAFLTVMGASQQKKREFKKEGISDYIQKPFKNRNLINRTKKLTAQSLLEKGFIKKNLKKRKK